LCQAFSKSATENSLRFVCHSATTFTHMRTVAVLCSSLERPRTLAASFTEPNNSSVSERAGASPFEVSQDRGRTMVLNYRPKPRVVLLIALALLPLACSNQEVQKQRHFKRGNEYAAEKRDEFAVIEYANAVRLDPKFG